MSLLFCTTGRKTNTNNIVSIKIYIMDICKMPIIWINIIYVHIVHICTFCAFLRTARINFYTTLEISLNPIFGIWCTKNWVIGKLLGYKIVPALSTKQNKKRSALIYIYIYIYIYIIFYDTSTLLIYTTVTAIFIIIMRWVGECALWCNMRV